MTKGTDVRRRPKQARSRAIVQAIEEACLRILTREGEASLSTGRIAEVAGVNIASVYRYFPHKDAIVAEVYERQLAREASALDALHDRAAEIDALPFEGTIALLVDVYCDHRLRLARLHEAFYRRHGHELDLGKRTSARHARSWRTQSRVWLAGVLARHRQDLPHAEVDRATLLALGALHGAAQAALRESSPLLAEPSFRSELVRLLVGYLGRENAVVVRRR